MNLMDYIPELTLPDEFNVKHSINNIPWNLEGLYFIFSKQKEILYIGQAACLRKRLRTHFSGGSHVRGSKDFYSFKFKEVKLAFERDIYETYYITKLRPKYNLAKNDKEVIEETRIQLEQETFNQVEDVEEYKPSFDENKPMDENDLKYYESLFNVRGIKTLEKQIEKYPDEWGEYISYLMNRL